MLKDEMESYVRIGERGLKNLTYSYLGEGVTNCQNHSYVINEWPLTHIQCRSATATFEERCRAYLNAQ